MLVIRIRFLAIALHAAHRQRTAIGKLQVVKLDSRRAGPGRMSGDGDFVSWFRRILAKACSRQLVRIAQLRAPMRNVALIVRNIE